MTNEQQQWLRDLSTQDLVALGLENVAFVKRIVVHDQVGWSIHMADGTQIAMADERDVAFAAVRQHNLEPLSVH
jgi:hypothetical protein